MNTKCKSVIVLVLLIVGFLQCIQRRAALPDGWNGAQMALEPADIGQHFRSLEGRCAGIGTRFQGIHGLLTGAGRFLK